MKYISDDIGKKVSTLGQSLSIGRYLSSSFYILYIRNYVVGYDDVCVWCIIFLVLHNHNIMETETHKYCKEQKKQFYKVSSSKTSYLIIFPLKR